MVRTANLCFFLKGMKKITKDNVSGKLIDYY